MKQNKQTTNNTFNARFALDKYISTTRGFESGTLIRWGSWILRRCGDVTTCFQKNIHF